MKTNKKGKNKIRSKNKKSKVKLPARNVVFNWVGNRVEPLANYGTNVTHSEEKHRLNKGAPTGGNIGRRKRSPYGRTAWKGPVSYRTVQVLPRSIRSFEALRYDRKIAADPGNRRDTTLGKPVRSPQLKKNFFFFFWLILGTWTWW